MNILKNGYSREKFEELINEIFSEKIEFLATPYKQELSDKEKEKIKNGYLLNGLKLDGKAFGIFEYQVNDELDLEKNKVSLVKKLIKDGKQYFYKALLAVYYNKKTDIWRLSLVKIKYAENGVEISSLKRYTYLLGKNIPVNTAIKQITNELINKEVTSIEDLLKAFSVEPVTKEFFKRYKEIFEKFNEYSYLNHISYDLFTDNDIEIRKKKIRDFNKKLLGRLVFLMFLQKKGWLNASSKDYKDGDKNFLSNFYQEAIKNKDKYFYNHYLEPLFYETLNKERDDHVFSITGKKIPFLNGGLFEKEANENISYPNKLFALLFNEDDGLFNQYNFTIIENDNIDQEVAVDPEMLGHIFENLLEDNKDKGAFYTPKEIVDYMSKSSLFEYLKTGFEKEKGELQENENDVLKELVFSPEIADFRKIFIEKNRELLNKLLNNVKILDPAIGSGAFPMGMLQAIIKVKEVLDHNLDRAEAKRNIIENSIYGVDIESGAVDIARLRFWLSLVVDENLPTPLPNLDFKIVVGNSLVSMFDGEVITLETGNKNFAIQKNSVELLPKLNELLKKFYNTQKEKNKYKKEIKDTQIEIIINLLDFKRKKFKDLMSINKPTVLDTEKNKQYINSELEFNQLSTTIDKLNKLKENNERLDFFNYKINFNEVFQENNGFDIIIGNPPFIDIKRIDADFVKILFNNYLTTKNRINLYSIFIEKGLSLCNKEGLLNFINPNSMLFNSSYLKLRDLIINDLEIVIKLPDNIFENATVETIIHLIKKSNKNMNVFVKYYKNNEHLNLNKINFSTFSRKIWKDDKNKRINIFLDKKHLDLIEKISLNKENISTYFDFSLGITPYDKYQGHTPEQIKNKVFHSSYKIDSNYVPLILGENILKYFINTKLIKKYLKYGKWLGSPRAEKFFINPHIIVRQILSGRPPRIYAGYTKEKAYFTQIGFSIISKKNNNSISLKYLTSLLNSKLLNFYHKYKFTDIEKITFSKILIENCKQLPIPNIIKENQAIFDNIVNQIITLKENNKNSDLLESKIDLMVYKLYELTYNEIKIIDPNFDSVLNQFEIDQVKYESMSIEEIGEM